MSSYMKNEKVWCLKAKTSFITHLVTQHHVSGLGVEDSRDLESSIRAASQLRE